MSAYRLYCLDGEGKIDFAEWIEAEDDRDALEKARELKRAALKCEVWQGRRLVASLDSRHLSAEPGQTAFLLSIDANAQGANVA